MNLPPAYQSYIDNIKAKTGLEPENFRKAAESKGLLRPEIKATEVLNWLKDEYGLGLGHARAIYGLIKPRKK